MKYFKILKFTLIIPANNKTVFYEWQNASRVFCSTPTYEKNPKGMCFNMGIPSDNDI